MAKKERARRSGICDGQGSGQTDRSIAHGNWICLAVVMAGFLVMQLMAVLKAVGIW